MSSTKKITRHSKRCSFIFGGSAQRSFARGMPSSSSLLITPFTRVFSEQSLNNTQFKLTILVCFGQFRRELNPLTRPCSQTQALTSTLPVHLCATATAETFPVSDLRSTCCYAAEPHVGRTLRLARSFSSSFGIKPVFLLRANCVCIFISNVAAWEGLASSCHLSNFRTFETS